MEVTDAACYREAHADHGVVVECGVLQTVIEGAQRMIVSNEQHLCHGTCPFDVSSNVTCGRKDML